MKNLEKRTHHKVRALFAENKVHFARGEQGFLICTDVCRGSIFGRTVRWGMDFQRFRTKLKQISKYARVYIE